MADKKPQTYANHRKFVPTYHFIAFGILVINLAWTIFRLIKEPSVGSVVAVLLALALIAMFLHLRLFPLTVQDRVIRLEERLRLKEILPEDLQPRIADLTRTQLVALRFAGDEELPGLVREVLDSKIENGEAIKKKIRSWRPDYFRC